jgi:hypothetical protein
MQSADQCNSRACLQKLGSSLLLFSLLLLFCVLSCSPDSAKRVQSQMCAVVRPMYSSPPIHGAAIVVAVLSGVRGCRQQVWQNRARQGTRSETFALATTAS